MSEGVPPPLPADVPPPQLAAGGTAPVVTTQIAPDQDPAIEERKARSAKTLAGWSIGCSAVLALFCGGGAWFVGRQLDLAVVREERAVERLRATQEKVRDAASLLEVVADRLRGDAAFGDLPATLPEAPPKDPWEHAIRYSRTAPRKATLSSAGPDGRFNSGDDVIRTLELE